MNKRGYSVLQRMGSFALALLMVLGLLPITALADDGASMPIGEVTTVADPDTVSRPADVYGDNTKNAGKVTVGKSVSDSAVTLSYGNTSQTFTPGENNFVVTVSQTAQVLGLASESPVPLDVVFILDTSGSMNRNGVNRAASMVTAANAAIETLMNANEHNRVAVVAFSSNGYGGGTSNDTAANVLSSLAHYTGDAATSHLRWVTEQGGTSGDGRNHIAGRDTVTVTVEAENWWQQDYTYETVACRHGYSGGTNIQAGIITGAKLLTAATNTTTVTTEDGVVTRMPFIVILSDGQPTYSYSNATWYDPTGTGQQGNGQNAYAGNGFLPALTAAYYKGAITEKYYGTEASEEKRCSIYTIGVQLNEELAEITLDPAKHFAPGANNYYNTFNSYWTSYDANPAAAFDIRVNQGNNGWYQISAASIAASKNYVTGKSSTGAVMYNGGLAYNDDYFAATETADIEAAFESVVSSIQQKAISAPTKVDDAYGHDFSGYVTFTDPIGEYMEVKEMFGLLADGKWYQGASFAYHLQNWSSAPESFKTQLIKTLKTRCQIVDADFDVETALAQVVASPNQAYYNSAADYDNSIVWWGNDIDTTKDVDEHVQYLAVADNDTIEYIQQNQATIEQLGADYVCRSYFFYGTAGDLDATPDGEYLYFVIRVQRSLKAPYQQTVVVSAPASLLSVEKVMVTETVDADGNVSYTAAVTEAEPARVIYEVGLRSDINAFNVAQIMAQDTAYRDETAEFDGQTVYTNYDAQEGTYTFYTNDWNRDAAESSHERAMTTATFDAAADNDFYTYQEDTRIYVKDGDSYVPYTGEGKPVGSGYYYERVVYDWSNARQNEDGTYEAVKKIEYIPVNLPDIDAIFAQDGDWYIAEGVYKASSLTGGEDVYKSENKTETSEVVVHPHRTSTENDSHYTVYLGNNGKLTLKSQQTKHVSIDKADGTTITDGDGKVVMVGDVLTYTLDVVNLSDEDVTADVTDVIPKGTVYVDGSATHGGQLVDGKLLWDDVPVKAGQTVQVSFKVTVTEAALSGEMDVSSIDNAAFVQLSNGFSYTTNTTTNPPEGKKTVDSEGKEITGGVQVPDVLVYRIRWHNDSGAEATVTITDIIPEGTTYVADSASHNGVYDADAGTITWTLKNIHAGASGVVSFRVYVNPDAVETIENDATIQIGDNDPRQTNETEVKVKSGNLVLTKTVITNGFAAAADQTFTLTIAEISQGMNGEYVMLRNGTAETVTFNKGVATVTIRHGDVLEIQGIPAGVILTVTEAAKNGFVASYMIGNTAGNTATIVADGDVQVDVTNTYDPDAVTFQLDGLKVLSTDVEVGDLVFGFTAYGCDANGENLDSSRLLTGEVTVSSDSREAQIKFGSVTFDAQGTYYYLISELNGGVTGVTYSTDKYLLAVTVTDDGSGQLKASAKLQKYDSTTDTFVDTAALTFNNRYAPKQTQLVLEADKQLSGRTLKAGEFSFVVTDDQGNVVSTGTNDADGNVTFRPITYTKPGTYTYTISEVNGGQHGVDYSTAKYVITVTVEDVNGQLVATPTYPANGVVFANTFTPDGITVQLEADKVLDNRSGDSSRVLKAGEFHFVVKEGDKEVATGVNDANGNIIFTPIGYTAADIGKTFTYTVSEVIPDLSGDPYMDYDETSFEVKVTVSQDANGNLVATVTYPDGGVVFTNIQHPGSIEITPEGTKTTNAINNNLPQNATFSFTVINVATGEEAGAGVGSANGTFKFSTMSFSEAGTYRYWIKETHAGMTQHGITYDNTAYLLVVEVTLTNGELDAEYAYYALAEGGNAENPDDYTVALTALPAFENHYDAKGQIDITASKELENLTLKEGDFAFRLIRQDNNHEITGIVAADGTIRFATLYFDLNDFESAEQTERILHYKMSEVVPAAAKLPGVTYDTTVHDVYIKITHDTATGTITAVLTNANGEPLVDGNGTATNDTGVVFTNVYVPEGTSATIEAEKTLTGRDLASGEFSFNLYHVDDAGVEHLVDTAINDANGLIRFTRTYAPSVLNGADSRQIHYVIREVNNHLSGVTYSGVEIRVTVTVVDNKDGTMTATVVYEGLEEGEQPTFNNTYKPAGTTYAPTATKVLENRTLGNGEFSFVVHDSQGNVVSTGINNADGTVTFTPIGYSAAGVYEYTVSEVKGNLPGVAYSTEVYKLVVTVVDNTEEGKLEATGVYYAITGTANANPVAAVFTNVYTPENVSVQMEASKELTGRDMTEGEFSFVVEMLDGTIVATGGNKAGSDGVSTDIIFSNIGYSLETLGGNDFVDLIYRIRELGTTQGGVTVDNTVYYAHVRVSNNEQLGRLETEVTYYSGYDGTNLTGKLEGVTFENTYAPAATDAVINADKVLINKVLEAGEFTFTLTDKAGNVLQVKTNAADGSVTFEAIEFTKPGTYIYTVTESVTDPSKADRYTLDDPYTVVVTVVDDLRGNLRATVAYYVTDASGNYDESVNMGAAEFVNTYTAPPVTKDLSLAINATKTVNTPAGVSYSPEGFVFHVVDIKNNVIATGVSDADGNIQFTDFTFDKAGEYHYWVYELDTDKGGIKEDTRAWEIHILVRYDAQTGLLYIADSDVQTYLHGSGNNEDMDPAFVNEYTPAPTSLKLTATKVLEGRPLNDREFLFYLMDGDQIAAVAYNDVNGTVTFELVYTEVGVHRYSIVEQAGSLGGVDYDTATYATVVVEVKDDGNGQLVAYIGEQALSNGATVATGVTVTNTYEAKDTTATVIAHKSLLGGKNLKGEDFIFELKNVDDPTEVYTAKNNADGHIEFVLNFDEAGEYTYELREIKGSDPSITYDETVHLVTVIVKDDAKGQLHAQVAYNTEDGHGPVFENTYKAQPVTAEIKAHKTLVGEKPLTAGQYFFELEGEGVKISDVTNDASGNVVFHVRFDTVGEYNYVIREVLGDELGTTYDSTEYAVKVVVTDDLNGNLVATVTYEGLEEGKIPGFTNSYKGEKVPVKITANKTLTNKSLAGEDFAFQLVDKLDPTKVLTAKNDVNGNVVFDLVFENSGVYVYTLSEVTGTDANITYDPATYTVTVTVTDDLQGYLTAKVEYATEDGAAPTFRNAYTPNAVSITLEGTKKLTGRDLEKDEFSFEVRDSKGNLVSTGKNTADGKILFTEIKLPVAGKYTFTVKEVEGSNISITYDETVYTVVVNVVNDNGTLKAEITYPETGIVFENTYEKYDPENPDTGDHSGMVMYMTAMFVSLIGFAAVLLVMKKRSYTAR